MTIHNDTLTRQWQILRLIPRYPRKRSATEIHHAIRAQNHNISKRTVERDLVALSVLFPIVADENERPYGWSWAQGAPAIDIPAMNDAEAVTFKLLERYLGFMLPPSYRSKLEPYFATAEQRLKNEHGTRRVRNFAEKIRVVEPIRGLIPRECVPGVQEVILEALLKEKRIALQYLRKGRCEPEYCRVNPCAVVRHWGRTFLLGIRQGGEPVEAYAMHRIRLAQMLEETAELPEGFDVDRYLFPKTYYERAQQGVRYQGHCTRDAAETLVDRPIGVDQRVVFGNDNVARFDVTLPTDARDFLARLEKEEGPVTDMGLLLFCGEFWGEQHPVPPIGGLED